MATNQIITSLVKATDVLKCLCSGVSKISEISRKLQYDKTTVYRILNTYEKQGFVTKDLYSRQYYPGPFLQKLSINPINTHQSLIYSVVDEMERLCRTIEETVHLQIPYASSRYLLHMVQADRDIIYHPYIGNSGPLYSGAAGKVLLSQYENAALKSMLNKIELVPRTKNTTTDKSILLEQIDIIRQQDYMVSYGENVLGSIAIAVPIRNYICPVALGMTGTEERVKEGIDSIINQLNRSRTTIEGNLNNLKKGE
jgi:IclR family transcriptional regulator, KDG regulon repressor